MKKPLPAKPYRPGAPLAHDGRDWIIEAVAHTGRALTARTTDGTPYRRERLPIRTK